MSVAIRRLWFAPALLCCSRTPWIQSLARPERAATGWCIAAPPVQRGMGVILVGMGSGAGGESWSHGGAGSWEGRAELWELLRVDGSDTSRMQQREGAEADAAAHKAMVVGDVTAGTGTAEELRVGVVLPTTAMPVPLQRELTVLLCPQEQVTSSSSPPGYTGRSCWPP